VGLSLRAINSTSQDSTSVDQAIDSTSQASTLVDPLPDS
jgi:hypothetical protein